MCERIPFTAPEGRKRTSEETPNSQPKRLPGCVTVTSGFLLGQQAVRPPSSASAAASQGNAERAGRAQPQGVGRPQFGSGQPRFEGTTWREAGGREPPLGARHAVEFAPQLPSMHRQACQAVPRRPEQSWEPAGRGRGGPFAAQAAPSRGTESPPRCSGPPRTHVLPSPPLVTLALTHINPISHTPHKLAAEHTRSHPDKDPRSPKRPRSSVRGSFPVPRGPAWRLRRGRRNLGCTGLFAAANPPFPGPAVPLTSFQATPPSPGAHRP